MTWGPMGRGGECPSCKKLAAENADLRRLGMESNDLIVRLGNENAAANATLDALRDLCGPNRTISNSTCMKMVDILYPQPKETTDDE